LTDLGRCVRYSPSSGVCACVYVNSKDVIFDDLLAPLLGPPIECPSFQASCVCGYVYMSVCMCSFFLSASGCACVCTRVCACVRTRLCVLTYLNDASVFASLVRRGLPCACTPRDTLTSRTGRTAAKGPNRHEMSIQSPELPRVTWPRPNSGEVAGLPPFFHFL